MELQDASEEFIQRVIMSGYESSLKGIQALLKDGPIGTAPRVEDVELHEWYKDLTEENKLMLEKVIKETSFRTLFGCLVIIDNLSMGYPIKGEVSDFAIYIQSYPDEASRLQNQPKESIRINHPKNNFSLHDMIFELIKR